jgi:exopolysaccharide biosynthesis polyprenyl glycosylphosphotransferase
MDDVYATGLGGTEQTPPSLVQGGRFRRSRLRIREGQAPAPTRARDARYRRLLACADVVAAGAAVMIAVPLLGDDDSVQLSTLVALPLVVAVSKVIGLYDRDQVVLRKSTLDEAPALFQQATLFTLVIWLLEDVLISGHLGRRQIILLWASLFACGSFGRTVARGAARHSTWPERCLVVGDPTAVQRVEDKLMLARGIKAEVVRHVPFLEQEPDDRVPLDVNLRQLVRDDAIDRVIVAPRSVSDSDAVLDVVRDAKALGVKVSLLPRICEVIGSSVEFDDVHGLTMLGVRQFRLSRSSLLLKRSFDIVGSAICLVATAPLMACSAVAILIDSGRPVFFHQTRIGRDGRPFRMLKFRTMVTTADEQKDSLRHLNEADGLFKITDDPRITRVGRFLRHTTMDELPQLLNVLRGEMSLVGPRPLVAEDDRRIEGWHRHRLHLTPGMTGHWQILGSSRVPLHDMVVLDYLYVANWSLWMDVKILLRTISFVFSARGL